MKKYQEVLSKLGDLIIENMNLKIENREIKQRLAKSQEEINNLTQKQQTILPSEFEIDVNKLSLSEVEQFKTLFENFKQRILL
jgi:regulator of replication initiation timing